MQTEECIYYDFGSFCDYSKKQLLILESKEAFFRAYLVTILKTLGGTYMALLWEEWIQS